VYDHHRERGQATPAWRRYHHDTAVALKRLQQLKPVLPNKPGRWLDIGCSTGALLSAARRSGWEVRGVEADAGFCEEVETVSGIAVVPYRTWLSVTWASLSGGVAKPMFDVVSMFDVAEHLTGVVDAFQAACSVIVPHGLLIVEVPDLDSCESAEVFRTYPHRKVDAEFTEHIWHFSERSLTELCRRHLGRGAVLRCERPVAGRLQFVWHKQ
jgi:2-polyprenyl-3-methyl-5-hydroxy-6-metoxy-1,4-benzoquinol methylase